MVLLRSTVIDAVAKTLDQAGETVRTADLCRKSSGTYDPALGQATKQELWRRVVRIVLLDRPPAVERDGVVFSPQARMALVEPPKAQAGGGSDSLPCRGDDLILAGTVYHIVDVRDRSAGLQAVFKVILEPVSGP